MYDTSASMFFFGLYSHIRKRGKGGPGGGVIIVEQLGVESELIRVLEFCIILFLYDGRGGPVSSFRCFVS